MQIVCVNFINIREIFDFFNVKSEIVCGAL